MVSAVSQWRVVAGLIAGGLLGATGLWAEEPVVDTGAAQPTEAQAPAMVQDGMAVQFEYTLLVDGAVVDSTEGRGPLRYVHGRHEIIPGLERQLAGLHVGDTRELTVNADEAYGPVDPSAIVEVPKEQLPSDVTPQAGLILRGTDPSGRTFRATISQVSEERVTLDLNHPLAGKTLLFKVKVTDIAPH